MSSLPGLDFDVHFGEIDAELPNWRGAGGISSDEDPGDEELKETPADVIAILGFDPKEFSPTANRLSPEEMPVSKRVGTLPLKDHERPFSKTVDNIFCPTGEGGGIDPSCSPGGAKAPTTKSVTLAPEPSAVAKDYQQAEDMLWDRNIVLRSDLSDKRTVDCANATLRTMDQMQTRFQGPAMKENAGQHIELLFVRGKTYSSGPGDDNSTMGSWSHENNTITIAGELRISDKAALRVGKKEWNVGTDLETTIRHEYGHSVFDRGVALEARSRWYTLCRKNDLVESRRYPYYSSFVKKHPISQYAGINPHEVFAESFAAYTSPKYKRGSLPPDVESYMDEQVGGIE